ncbi:MAG: hypothetical protein LBB31_05060 [Prevotellaceae bacterium]|jgi:hypothetical protein|nr:hypothetical protein [Prevotellaceae bacterium]
MPDWIQRNHAALHDQATFTKKYITATGNRDRMGFGVTTPLGQWFDTKFTAAYNTFDAAYTQWKNTETRTRGKTINLYAAEKAFKPFYRQLYTGFLKNNPLVTNHDLISMWMPKRSDGKCRPYPVPDTCVLSNVVLKGPAVLEIHFSDRDSHRKAKPFGVRGAEMLSLISDVPVTRWDELTNNQFCTRSPFRLTFRNDQRGKTLYFALRWENTRGEKGPWNYIQQTIIP